MSLAIWPQKASSPCNCFWNSLGELATGLHSIVDLVNGIKDRHIAFLTEEKAHGGDFTAFDFCRELRRSHG